MKRGSSTGQAALILIMIMSVIGVVSIGVASRSVENLRSSEIESTSSQSFKAAEAALEVALSSQTNVPSTALPGGVGNYSATYTSTGSDGFVSDLVDEGDVVAVSLVGAVGVNTLNVYWNTDSAIMVGVLDNTGTNYSVTYYTADPNDTRALSSKFGTTSNSPIPYAKGSYSFKAVSFGNKLSVPINLAAPIAPKLVRIKVLYQSGSIGIEPVGGTLVGQAVTINATGTAGNNVTTNLVFSRFSDRVPVVFDNVLYTSGSLSQ